MGENWGSFDEDSKINCIQVSRETEPGSCKPDGSEQEPDEGGEEGERPEEGSGSGHAGK